jgi:glutathione S-transferase
MITLHGFGRVHPMVIGETRDLRVQWALEETGLPYKVHGLDHTGGELDSPDFVGVSPFHQLPVIEDDGVVVTESGAIVYSWPRRPASSCPSTPRAAPR